VAGGAIDCWGDDQLGHLGDGGIADVTTAVDVLGIP
jgi:hypothetical protein